MRMQHDAARNLTESILENANKKENDALAADLRAYIRLYRPHAAREDTVLFPALHSLITRKEYDILSDKFENRRIVNRRQ